MDHPYYKTMLHSEYQSKNHSPIEFRSGGKEYEDMPIYKPNYTVANSKNSNMPFSSDKKKEKLNIQSLSNSPEEATEFPYSLIKVIGSIGCRLR